MIYVKSYLMCIHNIIDIAVESWMETQGKPVLKDQPGLTILRLFTNSLADVLAFCMAMTCLVCISYGFLFYPIVPCGIQISMVWGRGSRCYSGGRPLRLQELFVTVYTMWSCKYDAWTVWIQQEKSKSRAFAAPKQSTQLFHWQNEKGNGSPFEGHQVLCYCTNNYYMISIDII